MKRATARRQAAPLTPERQAFLGSAAIILACSIVALFGSYVTRVLYARTFTPADYGLLYAVITWLAILGMARNLGMGDALTYFVSRNLKDTAFGRRALGVTLAVQITLGIVVIIVSALLGTFVSRTLIPDPRVPHLLVVFGIAYAVIGITEAIVAYYRGRQAMLHVGMSEPLRNVVIAASSFVALMLERSLFSIALAWLFTYILSAVVYGLFLLRTVQQDKETEPKSTPHESSKTLLTNMLRYAFPSFLAAAGLFVFYNVDTVIITALLGTYQTGLYNAAIPLANLLLIVTVPITIVVFPAISALAGSGKHEELLRIHGLAARLGLVAALCCAAPFLVFGSQLLGYFFGNVYSAAAGALQVLLIGGIFRALVEIEFAVLAGLGAVRARAWLLGGALLCNTILNFWWVPIYGITGAAYATTLSFAFLLVVTVLYARTTHRVQLPTHILSKAGITAVPILVLTTVLAPHIPSLHFPALLASMALVSLVTLAWAWVCRLVTREDAASAIAFAKGLLPSLKART